MMLESRKSDPKRLLAPTSLERGGINCSIHLYVPPFNGPFRMQLLSQFSGKVVCIKQRDYRPSILKRGSARSRTLPRHGILAQVSPQPNPQAERTTTLSWFLTRADNSSPRPNNGLLFVLLLQVLLTPLLGFLLVLRPLLLRPMLAHDHPQRARQHSDEVMI